MAGEGNFFDRWARRKSEPAAADPSANPLAESSRQPGDGLWPSGTDTSAGAPVPVAEAAAAAPAGTTGPGKAPTREDAETLTPASDFSPFMNAGVETEVRNAALKKLFTDPHFNLMDGLDIYIDDYSKPDPLPPSVARQLLSSRYLGVFNEKEETPLPDVSQDREVAETAQPASETASRSLNVESASEAAEPSGMPASHSEDTPPATPT